MTARIRSSGTPFHSLRGLGIAAAAVAAVAGWALAGAAERAPRGDEGAPTTALAEVPTAPATASRESLGHGQMAPVAPLREFAIIDVARRETSSAGSTASPQYPFYPYDGTFTFVRIQTRSRGAWGWRGGWSHDYPDAEINFSLIVSEVTSVPVRLVPYGGNVLTFDDPRLSRFPLAYVSEPGDWQTTPEEAAALRDYLLRGGFVIFDDFFQYEMENLRRQMKVALPELDFVPIRGDEAIWNTFFAIDPLTVDLQGPNKNGIPAFYALYLENDPKERMLAIANAGADVGDLWEWSGEGIFPVDPTNLAFQIGVN